ncbi:MAG: 30S ribosomal protein S20 [Deltaproteobacteria bacterium]|nr:30S ribosomal protein S20 [Deltaproteobacteria bacterium]
MATHKSAEKRMRQSEKRRMKNASTKSSVKTRIKKVLEAVEGKDLEKSKEELYSTTKAISKAASEGVIHKNNASRKISRLTKKVNAIG